MQKNEVPSTADEQVRQGRFRLGAVGVVGVAAALSIPLTSVLGGLIVLASAAILAVQRRWTAMAIVLAVAAVCVVAWIFFITPVSGGGEFEISPADPDFVR